MFILRLLAGILIVAIGGCLLTYVLTRHTGYLECDCGKS